VMYLHTTRLLPTRSQSLRRTGKEAVDDLAYLLTDPKVLQFQLMLSTMNC